MLDFYRYSHGPVMRTYPNRYKRAAPNWGETRWPNQIMSEILRRMYVLASTTHCHPALTATQDLTEQVVKEDVSFANGGFSKVYKGIWTRPDGTQEQVCALGGQFLPSGVADVPSQGGCKRAHISKFGRRHTDGREHGEYLDYDLCFELITSDPVAPTPRKWFLVCFST
jgi:hypothetical protein